MNQAHGQPRNVTPSPPSAKTLAQVTDQLAWPLLLLRGDGSLLHANLAARQLLHGGQTLRLAPKTQRVGPADPNHQAAFDAALKSAAAAGGHCLLHWPAEEGAFSARVTSLAGPGSPLLLAVGAVRGRSADTRAYARLHGLTEAEARVLERLAQGDSSARAAAALGVTPATVRSQTVSLRRKTGHASVAELLRALAALPPMLPGGQGE